MKAVILAAGEGTRLRPFTHSEPKVMIPVANRPILQYVVEALSKNGIHQIVMIVGYHKERIMSYFEDGKRFGVSIEYVVQSKQLGTAHAVSLAKEFIDGDFIVAAGDNMIQPVTVRSLLDLEEDYGMVVCETDQPSKYGVVFLERGYVSKVVEKPDYEMTNLITTGIFRLSPRVFDEIEQLKEFSKHDLTTLFQYMLKKRIPIRAVHAENGTWADAVHPWDLLHLNTLAMKNVKQGRAGTIEEGVTIRGDVLIGNGSIIKSGTYIQGPCIIGKGCIIGPNVVLQPSTALGDNVHLEPFTTVSNSMIMRDCLVGSGSSISNSVLGEGVTLGPHFSSITGSCFISSNSDPTLSYKVEHAGAFMGEDCKLGASVCTSPGTILGARCRVGSLCRLSGKVKDNSRIL